MNFSIHLDDKTTSELDRLAKRTGRKRNSIIREAIAAFLRSGKKSKWPKGVADLAGAVKDLIPFETYRDELPAPDEDLFS